MSGKDEGLLFQALRRVEDLGALVKVGSDDYYAVSYVPSFSGDRIAPARGKMMSGRWYNLGTTSKNTQQGGLPCLFIRIRS